MRIPAGSGGGVESSSEVGAGALSLVRLIAALRPRALFFAFDERRLSLKTALHFVYRRLKRLPYYKKYSTQELKALLAHAGVARSSTLRDGDNSFVTSFE